jgi:hypothetical protein
LKKIREIGLIVSDFGTYYGFVTIGAFSHIFNQPQSTQHCVSQLEGMTNQSVSDRRYDEVELTS